MVLGAPRGFAPEGWAGAVAVARGGTGVANSNGASSAGAGSTTKLLHTGEPAFPTTFGLRSHANNRIVTAESGGAKSLIANRYNVGAWEDFTVVDAGHVVIHTGVREWQVVQEDRDRLRDRLEPLPGARPDPSRCLELLRRQLESQGLDGTLEAEVEVPVAESP